LQQQPALGLNLQAGAVRGQPGPGHHGNPRDKRAATGGGAADDNLRLVLVNQAAERLGLNLINKVLECGIVDHDDRISLVCEELFRLTVYAVAHHHAEHLTPAGVGESPCRTEKLMGDRLNLAVEHLGNDQDVFESSPFRIGWGVHQSLLMKTPICCLHQ